MNEFYQGIIATIIILSGLCGFQYFILSLFDRKVESKMEFLAENIEKALIDVLDQRKKSDDLYQIVIELLRDRKLR